MRGHVVSVNKQSTVEMPSFFFQLNFQPCAWELVGFCLKKMYKQISTVHVQSTKSTQQKKLDTNVNQKSKNLALQCTLEINTKNCNHVFS